MLHEASAITRRSYYWEQTKLLEPRFRDLFELLESQVVTALMQWGDTFTTAEKSGFFKVPDSSQVNAALPENISSNLWIQPQIQAERLVADVALLREIGLGAFLPEFIELLDVGETVGRERAIMVPDLLAQGWSLIDITTDNIPDFFYDFSTARTANEKLNKDVQALLATLNQSGIQIPIDRISLGQRFNPETGVLEKALFIRVIDVNGKPLIRYISLEERLQFQNLLRALLQVVAPLDS
jgi:hypothetical protein